MPAAVAALAQDRRIAEALLDISNAVGSVMETDLILDRICRIAARATGTNTCSVYLRDDEDPNFLVLRATFGLSRAQELGVRGFAMGEGPPGWAARENVTLRLRDVRGDFRNAKLDDTDDETRYIAFLCTPLRIQDEVVGVMSMRRAAPTDWTDEEAVFAEIIAKQIAIVLEKARLYREKVEAERLAAIAISLSEVAHYIKNVLQSMIGGAYFIDVGIKRADVDKVAHGWDMLKRSVEKIRALVENMLRFSKERQCELEPGDLNALVNELAIEVAETARLRGARLAVDLDQTVPELQLDREALHDAVLNLVTNALDALPGDRDGRVEVRTRHLAERHLVRIEVADNGSGIPPEAQPKMFKLFFTTKGRGGTGIGLAVTRKIVLEHGGQIGFDTEQGRGTTFWIELPTRGT